MKDKQLICEADIFFASQFVEGEKEEIFLCYLFASLRNGDQCIKIDPHFISLQWHEFIEYLIEGEKEFFDRWSINAYLQQKFLRYKNYWYLPINWHYETKIIDNAKRLSKHAPKIEISSTEIEQFLKEGLECNTLQKEQAKAIANACAHTVSLIYGGPGTGKSFTASRIVEVMCKSIKNLHNFEIMIGSPTGKATAHLRGQMIKYFPQLATHPLFKSATLHSLLDRKKFKEVDYLSADLIIIDECSMIDLRLFSSLLDRIKNGARLILIGDPKQISPIGTGSVFKELKECLIFPFTTLDINLRSKDFSLEEYAVAIREGNFNDFLKLSSSHTEAIRHYHFEKETSDRIQNHLIKEILMHLPDDRCIEQKAIQEYFSHFCVLSSIRKGILGVDTLNQKIYFEHKKKKGALNSLLVPIIITINAPELELYNGDLGILDEKANLAYFPTSKGICSLSKYCLPSYEYAYVLSIHKSQGSEYEKVIIVLPEESVHFGNELLYTAVTRARKKIELYANSHVLEDILSRQAPRTSALIERFIIDRQNSRS